ncbi:hypothetical protein [Pedococcus soli]
MRTKNGRVYASLPPAEGQARDEVPFGADESGAKQWMQAAMAARAAGVPVPDPRAYGALRGLKSATPGHADPDGRPAGPAGTALGVNTVTTAKVPAQQDPSPVAHLAHAFVPGRGHDIAALFPLFVTHYYRNLDAADAAREVAVEDLWAAHIMPFLKEQARTAHGSDVFCVEELTLVLSGQLRSRLLGKDAPNLELDHSVKPELTGSVSVEEAVVLTGASKATINRRRRDGRFAGAERVDGLWMIPLKDLRECGLLDGEPLRRGRPRQGAGLGTGSVGNIMWVLQKVVEFARNNGVVIVGNPTAGMTSKRSRNRTPRVDRPVVSLGTTRTLAAHMHVVHQAVLWMMRLLGMRISEVYGIKVSDILDDGGRYAVVRLRAQGGRKFLVRRGEDIVSVDEKEQLKNGESYRGIIVTGTVLAFVRGLIRVFHTAGDGTVDCDARLIPGLQEEGKSGQHSFRAALSSALAAERLSDLGKLEDKVVPHDLRKGLTTDLEWSEGLHRLALLRMFGHAPGDDVHGLAYTLDKPNHAASRAVAGRVHEMVEAELNGLTVVATAKEPSWGKDNPIRARREHVRGALAELGWLALHVPAADELSEPVLDAAQVASLLSQPVSTVRTWLAAGVIPGETHPGPNGRDQWYARISDVENFQSMEASKLHLSDVAAEVGATYHQVYVAMNRLGIELPRDQRTREYLVSEEARGMLVAEFGNVRAIASRTESVNEAASRLRVSSSVVLAWIRAGQLEADTASSVGEVRLMTGSVDALMLERPQTRKRAVAHTSPG